MKFAMSRTFMKKKMSKSQEYKDRQKIQKACSSFIILCPRLPELHQEEEIMNKHIKTF